MSRPVMIQDLPAAGVDLLGAEDGCDFILGNAALAEKLSGSDQEGVKKAAMGLEDEQLHELAAPAGDLLKVAGKLAMAVRLANWTLDQDAGYAAPLTALLGSALSDVIVLRHAELRRRKLVDVATAREPEPAAVEAALDEVRKLHRSTAEFVVELADRVGKLEGGRVREEPATT